MKRTPTNDGGKYEHETENPHEVSRVLLECRGKRRGEHDAEIGEDDTIEDEREKTPDVLGRDGEACREGREGT